MTFDVPLLLTSLVAFGSAIGLYLVLQYAKSLERVIEYEQVIVEDTISKIQTQIDTLAKVADNQGKTLDDVNKTLDRLIAKAIEAQNGR